MARSRVWRPAIGRSPKGSSLFLLLLFRVRGRDDVNADLFVGLINVETFEILPGGVGDMDRFDSGLVDDHRPRKRARWVHDFVMLENRVEVLLSAVPVFPNFLRSVR